MPYLRRSAFAPLVVCLLLGCGTRPVDEAASSRPGASSEQAPAAERGVVVALAPTVRWLTAGVAGPRVEVVEVWPAEGSSLDEQALATVAEAELVVRHGAGLDAWSTALDLPSSRLLDLSLGLDLIEREGTRHSHGEEGDHVHVEPLPGTWLDPQLVIESLDRLAERLRALGAGAVDEGRVLSLRESLGRLSQRLDALRGAVGPVSGPDSLAYLARRLDGPSSRPPLQLVAEAEEPTSETRHAKIEPLLPAPDDGDYLARFERNLARLEAALDEAAVAAPP